MSKLDAQPNGSSSRNLHSRRWLVSTFGVGAMTLALREYAHGDRAFSSDDEDKSRDSDHDDDNSHGIDHDDDNSHGSDRDDGDVRPMGTVPPGSMEVRIDDDDADGFEPGSITIDRGGSVTWVNVDDKPHTATGAEFGTGRIDPGGQATITFDEPGLFPYSCDFHPVMTGTIEVRDETGHVPEQPAASPNASPQASPAAGQGVTATITDFTFDPSNLEVSLGTTVVWTNNDSAPHTVTAVDESFRSDTLQPGDTFSHTFDAVGSFDYFCEFHANMKASVTVTG